MSKAEPASAERLRGCRLKPVTRGTAITGPARSGWPERLAGVAKGPKYSYRQEVEGWSSLEINKYPWLNLAFSVTSRCRHNFSTLARSSVKEYSRYQRAAASGKATKSPGFVNESLASRTTPFPAHSGPAPGAQLAASPSARCLCSRCASGGSAAPPAAVLPGRVCADPSGTPSPDAGRRAITNTVKMATSLPA